MTSLFDDEYYIVTRPREDDKLEDLLPDLGPDEETTALSFRYEALPVGHKPLIFKNSAKRFRDRRGMTTMKNPPEILFDGSNPLVPGWLRQKLLRLEIPNLVLQPSIFVDDWGTWHEDYWYLTFTDRFDCWDRKTSDFERGSPVRIAGESLYQVYDVRLDDGVMEKTPLAQRTLFQLGGSLDALVIAHRSVAGLFRGSDGKSGAQVISLPDYPHVW
jgi:hypothetical protein